MQQPTAQPEDSAERLRRVIGPTYPPRVGLPPMTLAIVALIMLMALVQFAAGGYQWREGDLGTPPIDWALGAKVPSLVAHGEYWRLVTANFLHGSWKHLIFNVVGLYVLGRLIEGFYGPARMFVIFVLSSSAGVAASYVLTPGISLGASTGVMGMMGALVWHNRRYRDYLPARMNYIYPVLLALVAFQFAMDSMQPEVDAMAHLGGFAAGLCVAMLLESRITGDGQDERDWLPLPTAVATAAGLLIYGGVGLALSLPRAVPMLRAGSSHNGGEQLELIRSIVAERPYFTEARLQFALMLSRVGRIDDAVREYRTAVAADPALMKTRYGLLVRDSLVNGYLVQASTLDQVGRPDLALPVLQQALQLDPAPKDAAEVRNSYAWFLVDRMKGDLKVAERYAVRANQDKPNEPAYLDTLAWIYLKQDRPEKALLTQLQAIEQAEKKPDRPRLKESLPEIYCHLGVIYERLGKTADAKRFYLKSLEKQPGYPDAQAGLDRLSDPSDEPIAPPSPVSGGTMI